MCIALYTTTVSFYCNYVGSGREDFFWLRGRPAEEPDPDPGPDDEREDVGEHNRVEELLPPLALLPEQREAVGAGLRACTGKLPSLGRRDVGPGRKDNFLILNKHCRMYRELQSHMKSDRATSPSLSVLM